MRPIADLYGKLDGIADNLPAVPDPRSAERPVGDGNPHNAWVIRTSLKSKAEGPLSGRRVAIKDNICVAGVPMGNGGALPADYVPEVDATVVTRILDAGGEIAGKAACEFGCLSGSSHTGRDGPVHNPHRRGYSAGGSSSGSAALVASGEVAMALGCDQGGSIRIPASYCGVYGLKPTFGLVPYTGIMTLDPSIDHCGPMTASVLDNALLLEVIAGSDGLDSRQRGVQRSSYTKELKRGLEGIRIAPLKEGFGGGDSDPAVEAKIRAAAEKLARLGASVEEVSIPWHLMGTAIWSAITHDGGFLSMSVSNGITVGMPGLHVASLAAASASRRQRSESEDHTVRIMRLFGAWSLERYRGHYYARAQNLRRSLRAAYDAEFTRVDLLLMPTMPTVAPALPKAGIDLDGYTRASWPMAANLCPFNATGHPALTAPCGTVEGLPVGVMLVGRHWDEGSIYRAAHAFETSYDWRVL
jgi:amidase